MLKRKLCIAFSCLNLLLISPGYASEGESEHEYSKSNKEYNHHEHGAATYPEIVSVPNGFQPEGVITGRGHTAYVGSLVNGAIYEINLQTGNGDLLFVGEPGVAAVGMAYDRRNHSIFVAGGLAGTVTVFDADDGSKLKTYYVGSAGGFINDGIVTRDAAYFTDSFLPVLYKIPLSDNGDLPDEGDVEILSLTGDFENVAGEFNGNGIEASKDGGHLFVVNSFSGKLFRVSPETGYATMVNLGGALLTSGDGLVRQGKSLYVVQNFINQVTEVKLSKKGLEGYINQVIMHPEFRIPTTASYFNDALYVINARFDVAPPPFPGLPPSDPETTFNLIRVALHD